MKKIKLKSKFGNKLLSREQMKAISGGYDPEDYMCGCGGTGNLNTYVASAICCDAVTYFSITYCDSAPATCRSMYDNFTTCYGVPYSCTQ